jgi:hypothetical protein
MIFPLGITSSGMRNLLEEWDSTRNNELRKADSDQQEQNVRQILKKVTISGSATTPMYYDGQLFSKFKYEIIVKAENKRDQALT